MFEALQPTINDFIVGIVSGVLTILAGFLIALVKKGFDWLTEKINTIQDEKLKSDATCAVETLERIVVTTVTALQQTIGDDIKESLKRQDGVYTKEDLIFLKNQAVETIKYQLTDATREILCDVYSDLDVFIGDLVEVSVRSLKESAPLIGEVISREEETSSNVLLG